MISGCGLGPPARAFAAAALALSLGACVGAGPDGDASKINALLAARGAPQPTPQRIGPGAGNLIPKSWLDRPMTVQRAVQAAMLRSPRLQRQYAELGLANADILQAIQIANPHVSLAYFPQLGGGGSQTEYGLAAPLADLFVLPTRMRLARMNYDRARFQIASAIFSVSLDVEAAWYRYVGAQQVADMRTTVADAFKTSADLAQRYFEAGNITELQLSREKAAASKARIDAVNAAVNARLARLDLNTAIGLTGSDVDWKIVDALPLPVTAEDDPAELHKLAAAYNLDLLAARKEADISEAADRLTRRFRLLGDATAGYYNEKDVNQAHSTIRGPTLDIELPIFNQGQARVARADAQLQRMQARLAELELSTSNGVDLAAERVRALSDVVRLYREALIPERESVTARSQEEQNFMLIGVFDVIATKAQEYDAYQGYLEAVRDYWLARVELIRLVGARLPSDLCIAPATASVAGLVEAPTLRPSLPQGAKP